MKKKILLIFVLLLLFQTHCYADSKVNTSEQVYNNQMNMIDTKEIEKFVNDLNNENSGYMPAIDIKQMLNEYKTGKVKFSFKDMLIGIVKYLLNDVLLNTKLLSKLVILAVICAILQNLEKAFNNDSVSSLAYYACYLVLIIIIVKSFSIAIDIGKDTITKMVDFMTALLPTLMALIASSSGVTTASILDPIIIISAQIVSNTIKNLIFPLIFLTSILTIVDNLSETFKISKMTALLKQATVWIMGFMLTIFFGIFTIRGSTGQVIDQVTAKTLKFAVDNFIPVVGKCLSDAVGTIAGYSLILKNALSTIGLLVLVSMCIFPLLKIISIIIVYKIAGALIEPISDKRIVNCLNSVGNYLTLIFASVLCVAVMFFIMISIIASTGRYII